MGGFYEIPHGVACAGLIAEANQATLNALIKESGSNKNAEISSQARTSAIFKMAKIGRLCAQERDLLGGTLSDSDLSELDYCQILVDTLFAWQKALNIPKFRKYGLKTDELDALVKASSNRNNPVVLSQTEIKALITACI
jgi:alcohol dehydrogenase